MHTPRDSMSEPAGPDADGLLRAACHEIERRLRGGEPARAEELLARHPALNEDPEQALDLIFVEYITRRQLGESPPRTEFLDRFPRWRAELDRQFQLEELLNGPTLTSTRRGEEGATSTRFRVSRLLARGGIGQVMRAIDTELNREVAIKQIQASLAANDDVRERFLREAEITAKLEHPGVVPVYGLGLDAAGRGSSSKSCCGVFCAFARPSNSRTAAG
jgi:hypothetical protein